MRHAESEKAGITATPWLQERLPYGHPPPAGVWLTPAAFRRLGLPDSAFVAASSDVEEQPLICISAKDPDVSFRMAGKLRRYC